MLRTYMVPIALCEIVYPFSKTIYSLSITNTPLSGSVLLCYLGDFYLAVWLAVAVAAGVATF
jgi:hypothetical protein